MARIDVPFVVRGQIIEQKPRVKIAAGGQNYIYAVFDLCGVWSDIDYKKAVFRRGNDPYIMDLIHSDDHLECRIPWEVMQSPGFFDTGIFGGSRLPTNLARTFVIEGCVEDGKEPQPPTPDWFDKMEHDIDNIAGGLPRGGKAGQYLCKLSDKDHDIGWCNLVIPEQYGLITYDQDKTITIT